MALSDPEGILASPLTIIERSDDGADIEAIIGIVKKQRVNRIIVGLPISMSGSTGLQAEKVKAFAQKLGSHKNVTVEFRDERLTTVSARRLVVAGGRKMRGKVRHDAIAAAIILQGYLDEARG